MVYPCHEFMPKCKISINFYAHLVIFEFYSSTSFIRIDDRVYFFQSRTLTGKSLFPRENNMNENLHPTLHCVLPRRVFIENQFNLTTKL